MDTLGLLIDEVGLGIDADTRDVDDILNCVRKRLLVLGENALGFVVRPPVVFLHRKLNHHCRLSEQLTSDLKILLIGVRGHRPLVFFNTAMSKESWRLKAVGREEGLAIEVARSAARSAYLLAIPQWV